MRWLGMVSVLFGFVAIGLGLWWLSGYGLGNVLWAGFLDMLLMIALFLLVFLGAMGVARMTNKIKQRLERQEQLQGERDDEE